MHIHMNETASRKNIFRCAFLYTVGMVYLNIRTGYLFLIASLSILYAHIYASVLCLCTIFVNNFYFLLCLLPHSIFTIGKSI